MALMTTSGSMPFFLGERLDGLLQRIRHCSASLEFHFQIRPRDHAERHAVRAGRRRLRSRHVPASSSTPPSRPLKYPWPSTASRITSFARRPANRR